MSRIDETISEMKGDIKVIRNMMENLNKKMDSLEGKMDRYEERLSSVENKQGQLDTKLTAIAIFQLIFSSVLSGIAGFFGKKI